MTKKLTFERLREVLDYSIISGRFYWRDFAGRRKIKAGSRAGWYRKDGYCSIGVDGISYYAHQLAWLYVTGEWCETEIDHHDGHTSNNAFLNLRHSTRSQNMFNTTGHVDSVSGSKGVSYDQKRKKWYVRVNHKGKVYWGGRFDDVASAETSARALRDRIHGEFSRHE